MPFLQKAIYTISSIFTITFIIWAVGTGAVVTIVGLFYEKGEDIEPLYWGSISGFAIGLAGLIFSVYFAWKKLWAKG